MLQREFTFKVKDNKYRVSIPNPGQLLAIETEKASISMGIYRNIMAANTIGSNYALDIVDMQAYLSVLVPDLLKDLKAPILELDLLDFNQLKKEYSEQFIPWVNSWMSMINAAPEKIVESQGVSSSPVEQSELGTESASAGQFESLSNA